MNNLINFLRKWTNSLPKINQSPSTMFPTHFPNSLNFRKSQLNLNMTIICNAKVPLTLILPIQMKAISNSISHICMWLINNSMALLFIIMMLIVVEIIKFWLGLLSNVACLSLGGNAWQTSHGCIKLLLSTRIAAEITLIQRQPEHFWIPKPWEVSLPCGSQ